MNRSRQVSLAALALTFGLSWVHPIWPADQALHDSLTVLGIIALLWYDRRYRLSDNSFILICLFMAVHSVVAHWLYSNFPYDRWCREWFDWSPQLAFGWQRNHTDRLVHFLYGLCFAPAIADHFVRSRHRLNATDAGRMAVLLIMASSLLYEWFEWTVAVTLSPEDAEAYNGQQGDMWDAHKDMLLATLGALLWHIWPGRTAIAPTPDNSRSSEV